MIISQLKYNERTGRIEHDGDGLHCGDGLEVLIVDPDGSTRWVATCIEMSENKWYLTGLPGVEVVGLFARA